MAWGLAVLGCRAWDLGSWVCLWVYSPPKVDRNGLGSIIIRFPFTPCSIYLRVTTRLRCSSSGLVLALLPGLGKGLGAGATTKANKGLR